MHGNKINNTEQTTSAGGRKACFELLPQNCFVRHVDAHPAGREALGGVGRRLAVHRLRNSTATAHDDGTSHTAEERRAQQNKRRSICCGHGERGLPLLNQVTIPARMTQRGASCTPSQHLHLSTCSVFAQYLTPASSAQRQHAAPGKQAAHPAVGRHAGRQE